MVFRTSPSLVRVAALIVAVAVALSACGGDEETPAGGGIASVEDLESTTTTASPASTEEVVASVPADDDGASTEEGATGNGAEAEAGTLPSAPAMSDDPSEISSIEAQETAVLALSSCMRDEGVENFPDVGVGSNGALDLAAVFRAGVDFQSAEFIAALDVCGPLVSDITFSTAAVPDPAAIADQLFGFSQCLRNEGIDVGDVAVTELLTRQSAVPDDVSSPEEGIAYFFELDADDPTVLAAIDVCDVELVGLPGVG